MDTPTVSQLAAATAIEVERHRLKREFENVYRPDGTINEDALWRFACKLFGQEVPR